jgi:hypothetical protein
MLSGIGWHGYWAVLLLINAMVNFQCACNYPVHTFCYRQLSVCRPMHIRTNGISKVSEFSHCRAVENVLLSCVHVVLGSNLPLSIDVVSEVLCFLREPTVAMMSELLDREICVAMMSELLDREICVEVDDRAGDKKWSFDAYLLCFFRN